MEQWLKLFGSKNPVVRKRAAAVILDHGDIAPLPTLLEILDDLHNDLGGKTERVLLARRDPELLPEMVARLRSSSAFVREVACWVLREFRDRSTTRHLLAALGDETFMVRRAAACALAAIADPESGPTILQHYQGRRENINVLIGLESALDALNIPYKRQPR